MTQRLPIVVTGAMLLPVMVVVCLWLFGWLDPVSVRGVTAYPVLRAGALALYGSVFLTLVILWLLSEDQKPLRRGIVLLCLIVLVAAIILERLYTFHEAFERDLMAYMVVADRWLDGQALYADIWDNKPPMIHWTYALFARIFGPTPLALWAMGVSASVATMAGCYVAARRMAGTLAGLGAAFLWAFVSGDLPLQGNQPNVEVFMNAALVWAFALLLPARTGWSSYAAAGVLFALASLYKQVAAVVAILMVLTYAVDRWRVESRLSTAIMPVLVIGGIGLAAWAIVFAAFWSTGTYRDFVDAVFGFNRTYAGDIIDNLFLTLNVYAQPARSLIGYAPLFVLVAGVAFLGFSRRGAPAERLLAAYLVGAVLMVMLPGKFFPHYYQLVLPVLAIGAGVLFARTIAAREGLPVMLLLLSVLFLVAARGSQANISLMDIPSFKYGRHGVESEEIRQMADWINQTQPAGAHIYHWGAEPGVWFWSGRKPMTPFIFNFPLYGDSDLTRRYVDDQIAALNLNPPDLIVAKRREIAVQDHPVEQWIARRYTLVPGPEGITQYVFLVPRHPAR